MTTTVTQTTWKYSGDGETKVFPYTFSITNEDDIKLYLDEGSTGLSVMVNSSDYEVSYDSETEGGSITYPLGELDPLTSVDKLAITRDTVLKQETDLTDQEYLKGSTVEGMGDNNNRQVQDLSGKMERAILTDINSDETGEDLLSDITEARETCVESAAAASSSETNAAISEANAAASAASINLPAIVAGAYLKADASGDGYETTAPADVLTDIGAINTVVAGAGIVVDNTDIENPIINAALSPKFIEPGTLMPSLEIDADHDITISAGKCRAASDVVDITLLSPITKQTDANWIEGDAAGGMPTSVVQTGVYTTTGTAVTGTGTSFTTDYVVGDIFWCDSLSEGSQIITITDDLNLTLQTALASDITVAEDPYKNGLVRGVSYYEFVISKADGTTDAGFDTSLTAVNLLADSVVSGAGYLYYRAVVKLWTDASSNILPDSLLSYSLEPELVDKWQDGTSWYKKYTNGLIEQGGWVGGAATMYFTFYLEHKDTNYVISMQELSGAASYASNGQVISARTTTGMTAKIFSSVGVVQWKTSGY